MSARDSTKKEKIRIVLKTNDEYVVVHGEVIAKFPVKRGKIEKETKAQVEGDNKAM